MLLNYYSLIKLEKEFKELEGLEIISCFSQEKDSIIIEFNSDDRLYLDFSSDNKYSCCFLSTDFRRSGKNTIDLFDDLVGEVIQKVSLAHFDRIFKIELIHSNLYLILFGRGSSNIILTKKDNLIIDALNNFNSLKNTKFNIQENNFNLDDNIPVIEALTKLPYIMGNKLANEFIFRDNLQKDILIKELNDELKIEEFKNSIINDKNYIYNQDNIITLSPIELTYLNLTPLRVFNSISEAIKWRKINFINADKINEESKGLLNKIELELKKINSRLRAANDYFSLLELADTYRINADLLMSSTNLKQKYGNAINLVNWEGNEVLIKLDEKLNIVENATRYYTKAKKTEKDAILKEKEIPELTRKLNKYQKIKEDFNTCNSLKDLKNFKITYATELNLKLSKKMEEESKFRHFEYEGFEIFVGKSAANNDELTMKFARPNDIWLHARGVPGSHTIIKLQAKDKIRKEVIEYAASLAAYYSQSRKASLVPVIYTEKKYVRKPKGANPGSVSVQKENVIMVRPTSPEELGK